MECLGKYAEWKAPGDDCFQSLAQEKWLYKHGNTFMIVTPFCFLNCLCLGSYRRNCLHTLVLLSIPSTSLHVYPRKGSDNELGRQGYKQPEVTVSERQDPGITYAHCILLFPLSFLVSKLKAFLERPLPQSTLSTFSLFHLLLFSSLRRLPTFRLKRNE